MYDILFELQPEYFTTLLRFNIKRFSIKRFSIVKLFNTIKKYLVKYIN